ncbi:MAG: hypothetical protein DYG82_07255 [Candidatus Jettenia sp. AMX1]|nr:hypothetical protein [Candidatus Jettenia sp. AMX1]
MLPVARVHGFEPEDLDPKEKFNIYVFNTLSSWVGEIENPRSLLSFSLITFLEKFKRGKDKKDRPVLRVAIFDQFEEIFTSYPEHWKEREDFFRQVNSALEADHLLRVLFIIREDFLANLDPYVDFLPKRLRIRYPLERLREKAACEAVSKPLDGTGYTFAEGVAEHLVEELLKIRVKGSKDTIGQFVEPVQLQVLCYDLFNNLPPGVTKITSDLLIKYIDVDEVLKRYYENAIKKTKKHVKERRLRRWFDEKLITPAGTRGTVFCDEKSKCTGGVPNKAVEVLQQEHIIRSETRAGAQWYELAHDRFITPIQNSNRSWNKSALKRTYVKLIIVLLVISCPSILGIQFLLHKYEYHQNTDKIIEVLKKKYDGKNYDYLNKCVDGDLYKVASYLWNPPPTSIFSYVSYLWRKQDCQRLESLLNYLREVKDIIIKFYGVNKSSLESSFDTEKEQSETEYYESDNSSIKTSSDKYLFILKFNSKFLDKSQLQYYWKNIAGNFFSSFGIPVPLRLKFEEDENLSSDKICIRLPNPPEGSYEKSEKKEPQSLREQKLIEQKTGKQRSGKKPLEVSISWDQIWIPTQNLPESIMNFYDNGNHEWEWIAADKETVLSVPRWTLPLWKAIPWQVYPPEKTVMYSLCKELNKELSENSQYIAILTTGAIESLRAYIPQTIEEMLFARDSLDDVQKVLIEVIKKNSEKKYPLTEFPITQIAQLLDALAKYPSSDFNAQEAAEKIMEDLFKKTEPCNKLTGSKRKREVIQAGVKDTYYDKKDYDKTDGYSLPTFQLPIRVYLGKGLLNYFRRPDDNSLTTEVLESIAEVRGDIYKKFGVTPPGVRFREGIDLKENEFMIEILNQSGKDVSTKPIQPDVGVVEYFSKELLEQLIEWRAKWLSAENVQEILEGLPKALCNWVEAQYTLTDLKQILRAVIASDKRGIHEIESVTTNIQDNLSGQTIRYPSWLLGSLVFWVNVVKNRLDGEEISNYLRQTQNARLYPPYKGIQEKKVYKLIKDGIQKLHSENIDEAEHLFQKAVKDNSVAALYTFLHLYAKAPQLSLKEQVRMPLNESKSLPSAGNVSTWNSYADVIVRCELEEFREHFEQSINSDLRRKIQLCLLSRYKAEGLTSKKGEIQELLIKQHHDREEIWSPDDEYLLAFWILADNAQSFSPHEQFNQIDELLVSAFQKWKEDKASIAFEELINNVYTGNYPRWFLSMLETLAKQRPKSYWIPSLLGQLLMGQSISGADIMNAHNWLIKAKNNISLLNMIDDRERMLSWHNYFDAQACINMAIYEQKNREQFCKQAKDLLNELKSSVLSNIDKTGWPVLDDIYKSLADVFILMNDYEQAANIVEEGLHNSGEHQNLLYEKFFVHLARLQIDLAVKLAKEVMNGPQRDNPDILYLAALAQILTREGEYEYVGRYFIDTSHEYTDYIRMMLSWSLSTKGKTEEGQDILFERWKTIDPNTWSERMGQGDAKVWKEMLIGYYLGNIQSNMIFGPLEDREIFEHSTLSCLGQSLEGLRCEAYFYDALLQGISGNPTTRKERMLDRLEKVQETRIPIYYEYHMARYLKGQLMKEQTN